MRKPLAAILAFCLAACTRGASETPEPIKEVLALYAPGVILGESANSLVQRSDLSFSPYVGYTDTLQRPVDGFHVVVAETRSVTMSNPPKGSDRIRAIRLISDQELSSRAAEHRLLAMLPTTPHEGCAGRGSELRVMEWRLDHGFGIALVEPGGNSGRTEPLKTQILAYSKDHPLDELVVGYQLAPCPRRP
jgi:hypothetical protein